MDTILFLHVLYYFHEMKLYRSLAPAFYRSDALSNFVSVQSAVVICDDKVKRRGSRANKLEMYDCLLYSAKFMSI